MHFTLPYFKSSHISGQWLNGWTDITKSNKMTIYLIKIHLGRIWVIRTASAALNELGWTVIFRPVWVSKVYRSFRRRSSRQSHFGLVHAAASWARKTGETASSNFPKTAGNYRPGRLWVLKLSILRLNYPQSGRFSAWIWYFFARKFSDKKKILQQTKIESQRH